jgi:hypothetical protein
MATLLDIVTAVRDEISEPQPGFVSDTELKRWINRANYDLADAAGVESTTAQTITTSTDVESYALNADAGLVEQVERVDPSNSNLFTILTPLSLAERASDHGSPRGYFVLGSSLYTVPKPDAAYTLRVWYARIGVTLVADGDTPIIPARFHDLLTLFAVSQAKRKGDDPAYLTYLQDYVAGRDGMVVYLRARGSADGRRIIDLDDSGADGL